MECYHGTIQSLVPGATLRLDASEHTEADKLLDAGRPTSSGGRSSCVWASPNVREATAIASIHARWRGDSIPHLAIRVYRVRLERFHSGPVAIIEELQQRLLTGAPVEQLIREYWNPTGAWHVTEVLASHLTVEAEVAPASEAQVYIPRWVWYNEDRKRARAL